MEAGDLEGETRPQLPDEGQEIALADPLAGGHQLPLGFTVHDVDVIDALDAVLVALVDAVDADETRPAIGRGGAPMATGAPLVLVQCCRRAA